VADSSAVGSPDWWISRLYSRLMARRPEIDRLESYYRGDHPLPEAPVKQQREYLKALQRSRTNFMRLVIDATAQRLHVQGVRLGDSEVGDQDSWSRLWQPNCLDADSRQVHIVALYSKISYVSVWENPDDPETPLITPEHPSECIVETVPGMRRKRAAALKAWRDDWTGDEFATLYLPDGLYPYKRVAAQASPLGNITSPRPIQMVTSWVPRGDVIPNPLGVVPVVPFRNNPSMLDDGVSELVDLTPIQDRINTTVFRRSMAEWLSAYRQKWITGFKVQKDANGQPIRPFDPGLDTLWVAEDAGAHFGDFAEHNLTNYISAMTADIHAMSAISQVPSHYLINTTGQPASGDSLKAAEAGLVAKTRDRMEPFSDAWEEVIRLGWQVLDDPKGKITDAEMLWRSPEFRTEGELTDAVIKRVASQLITVRQGREDMGYTPQQIQRMEAEDRKTALQSAATSSLFGSQAPAGAPPTPAGSMPMSYMAPPALTPNDKSVGS
jgi:hypothetical protein